MDENTQGVSADLLKRATQIPKGMTLEPFNPLEVIPTLAVGDDFAEGMTIGGYFVETQTLASPKFKNSNTRNAEGIPTQLRHVLRVGSPTGEKIAIWNTGELKLAFEKIQPGTFVTLTYKGKGENAKGQQQHFFEIQKTATN